MPEIFIIKPCLLPFNYKKPCHLTALKIYIGIKFKDSNNNSRVKRVGHDLSKYYNIVNMYFRVESKMTK